MACSDSPNLRHYAFMQGLINIEEPFLRNEIMLKALMEKQRVDVELGASSEMTKGDKEFVKKTRWSLFEKSDLSLAACRVHQF